MDGGSRDPSAGRDEGPCGAGGVHGWQLAVETEALARELTRRGIVTLSGKARWSATHPRRLFLALRAPGLLPALGPLAPAVSPFGVALLAVGGALYTVRVGFHLWRSLPFQNAVWHGFVLAAAACHYAAVLHEVAAA